MLFSYQLHIADSEAQFSGGQLQIDPCSFAAKQIRGEFSLVLSSSTPDCSKRLRR
jgi:hypothetical protein